MTRPMMEVRTAPNEKLRGRVGSFQTPYSARSSNSQSAERGEEVVMGFGDVLKEEGAVGGHRASYSSSQAEKGDAQPEEAGCEC